MAKKAAPTSPGTTDAVALLQESMNELRERLAARVRRDPDLAHDVATLDALGRALAALGHDEPSRDPLDLGTASGVTRPAASSPDRTGPQRAPLGSAPGTGAFESRFEVYADSELVLRAIAGLNEGTASIEFQSGDGTDHSLRFEWQATPTPAKSVTGPVVDPSWTPVTITVDGGTPTAGIVRGGCIYWPDRPTVPIGLNDLGLGNDDIELWKRRFQLPWLPGPATGAKDLADWAGCVADFAGAGAGIGGMIGGVGGSPATVAGALAGAATGAAIGGALGTSFGIGYCTVDQFMGPSGGGRPERGDDPLAMMETDWIKSLGTGTAHPLSPWPKVGLDALR